MAVPDPQHFFDQAAKLMAPPGRKPTQVDLRRAISAAYYGLFHAVATAAADQFVGLAKRSTNEYALVYRNVRHKELKVLCKSAACLSALYQSYAPARNFGPHIQEFASGVVQLQEKRHKYAYDPRADATFSDATMAVKQARTALEEFTKADLALCEAFLGFVLFKPRQD